MENQNTTTQINLETLSAEQLQQLRKELTAKIKPTQGLELCA